MTILLGAKTHYSLRKAFGSPRDVARAASEAGYSILGVADIDSCVSHRELQSACKEFAIKPVYGVNLQDIDGQRRIYFAKNHLGLPWLHDAISTALRKGTIAVAPEDVIRIQNGNYLGYLDSPLRNERFALSLATSIYAAKRQVEKGHRPIILSDALYPKRANKAAYELLGRRIARTNLWDQHILNGDDMTDRLAMKFGVDIVNKAMSETARLMTELHFFDLPASDQKIEIKDGADIRQICQDVINLGEYGSEYMQRIEYELRIIESKGFEWYFALVSGVISHVKSKGEIIGPGRGSCCGSLVCFALGITDIDPLKHGLLFERFIDTSRPDLPDIDIDFTPNGRMLAYDYVAQKFPNIASLITVSRYHYLSLEKDIKRDYGYDTPIPSAIFDLVDTPRHYGLHPAAIAISSRPLNELAPVNAQGALMLESGLHRQTAEIDAGIVKIDALGLSQVQIFKELCDSTKTELSRYYEIKPEIVAKFNDRKYSGVFQFGYAVKSIAEQVNFDKFSDIADVIALARPGPRDAGYADRWVANKLSGSASPQGIPELDAILTDTKGVLIYQEQIMKICRDVAGFSWPEVNEVRRGVGKKKPEIIEKYRARFVDNCHKKYDKPLSYWENVWNAIEGCGNYAFNRSHAVAYALIAYACVHMKALHPGEYCAAYLGQESDDKLKIEAIKELENEFEFVKFDESASEPTRWVFRHNKLFAPLTNVIGIGAKTALDAAIQRANTGFLPAKFRGENVAKMRYRISSIAPIWQSFKAKYPTLADAGIATPPVSVKEFCGDNAPDQSLLIGLVEQKSVKDYKWDSRGKTPQYVSFRLTDDTGQIWVRYHPYASDKLVKAIGEIQGGKLIAVKGNIYRRDNFQMVMCERYRVL